MSCFGNENSFELYPEFTTHFMKRECGLDIKQEIDDSEDIVENINKHGLEYEFLGTVKNEDTDEIVIKENSLIKVGRDGSECHKQMKIELDQVQYQISEMKHEKKFSEESDSDLETDKESKEQNVVWIAENRMNLEPGETTSKEDTQAYGEVHLYKCNSCEYETKKKRLLVRHFKRVHDENIDMISCDLCEFRTKYKNSFQRHRNTMHNGICQGYECHFCDCKFKSRHGMRFHIKKLHSLNVEWFQCHICDRKYRYKCGLREHIKYKHNENEWLKCNLCERKYKYKRGLMAHIKNEHSEDEWYQNNICDRKCKYKCHLKAHSKYKHSENLEWHINSRHNEDPEWYKCQLCEFETVVETRLSEHKRNNHDVTWHHCSLCEFSTKTAHDIENHMKYCHSEFDYLQGVNMDIKENSLNNSVLEIIRTEEEALNNKCSDIVKSEDIKEGISESANPVSSSKCLENTNTKDIKGVNPISSNVCFEIMKTEDIKEVTFTENMTSQANCDNSECHDGMTLKLRNAWKKISKKIQNESR